MAQDTTPAIVVYQGTGSDAPFSIPFDKGYYGEIKVLFVRRGLADYTYYPDTYVVSGRLYAWQNGNTRVFTHTPRPAVGAVIYTDEDVAPVTSITLKDLSDNENIYLRSAEDDVLVRRLYAWKYENTIVYTDTPNPTLSSIVTDYQWHELPLRIVSLTNIVVSAISGQTITVDEVIYTRAVQHDISNNLLLTWTGDTLEVGDFICIIRDTERGQPYEMPINQKHVEFALDNLERQIQELKDATDSALKVDPSYDIEDSHKMNPIQWLETILRSMDKSVRAFRYADGWLDYSLDDPNIAEISKTWRHLLSTENIKNIREASRVLDDEIIYWTEYQDREGNWKPLCKPDEWDSKIDEALEISQEAKDTADEAKEIAVNAQTVAGQAKDIAEDAKETAEGIEDIAQEALDKVTQEITDREDADEDLQDQIDSLSGRGRYLSIWNCTTGLAESNPPTSPYTYQSGDYFIVGTVGATNYKPDGSSYTTGVASTTVETAEVKVDDVYLYDGTNWKLLASSQRTYTFAGIAGSPYDNTALGNALNGKVDANAAITGATHTKITYDNKGLVTAGADITLSDVTDITATAAEVNVLDGITASTTELNYVDGVTSSIQTQINSKPANTNRVNGAPLSNSASVFYGTSDTAAATTEKEVSIPSITTLDTGTIIIVQPTITSTVANSTIKLNSFAAYPMRYNNAAITTSTDSIVWNAAYPSVWVFDGTYWRFVAHGIDSNTTYSTMSVAEGTTGTATSNRVLQAVNLKQIIQGTTLTGIDVVTTGAVSATDTITEGIGKLQATKADTSVLATVATTGDYTDLLNKPTIPAAQVNSDWNANSGVAQILNKPTLGTAAAANTTDFATAAQGALADTAVQPGDLATVATTGDYDDLLNKPTIPTVNDATLTIQKNGTSVATFTANASSNVTANISVPTTAGDVGAVAANASITGATKCKITYDSKGLVTAGADLSAGDIPDLSATYQPLLTAGEGILINGDNDIMTNNIIWRYW